MAPIRIAVVGLGYWGPNLVRNLHELPGAELTTVCDMRQEALDAISRRYPAVATTTSFDEVVADPDIDAIAIATPVSTHYPLASAALDAGKHVFIEKPLAASSQEANDLLERAAERELVLMPGHTFLYSPPVNTIRDLIESGELGDSHDSSTCATAPEAYFRLMKQTSGTWGKRQPRLSAETSVGRASSQ